MHDTPLPHPPMTVTSLQRPLSLPRKVAIAERFECISPKYCAESAFLSVLCTRWIWKSKDVLYGVWLFWPKCQASLQGVRPPETLFSQFTLQRKLTISHGFTFNILGNNFNQLDDKSGAFACLVQVLTPSCIASVQRFLTAGRATILLIGLTAQMDGWTCYFVHMGILATQAIWVFVGGP